MSDCELPENRGASMPEGTAAPRRAHLVGACGTGVRGLAEILSQWQWQLSGSDQQPPPETIQRLIRQGFTFHPRHAADNLPAALDQLIYSPAIPSDNPERVAARKRGIPELSYPQAVGQFLQSHRGVCVAGTHGKSTTTAMTATILTEAGLRPSALFGAELCTSGRSAWGDQGDLFVVESCEFQRSFLEYHPAAAAILSVEPDHFDCFTDRRDLVEAFATFASQVREDGFLLIRREDPACEAIAERARCSVLTFGWTSDADWWADDLRRTSNGYRARVFRRSQFLLEVTVPLPGKHNVLNALAAAAMAYELGVSPSIIRQSIAEFGGIRRRFERLGSWRGVTLIDDYAHHPTAVQATLQAAREIFAGRTVWAVFQPHQVSRTIALMDEFAESLRLADHVLIPPIYAAREAVEQEPVQVSCELVARCRARGISADFSPSLDQLVMDLEDRLQPGHVLLTMGAGDIDRIQYALTRRVSGDSSAGRTAGSLHVAESGGASSVLPHSA